MSGGVEYQPITSCPEPKPSCLSELRQEWGAERKTLKQVFFFWCKFGNSAWTPFLLHQAGAAQAGAHLDCCCIHSSRDSLKPSSIQTAVLSKFQANTHFMQVRHDQVLSLTDAC